MVSLKVKEASRIEVQAGLVDVNGPVVALYEKSKGKDSEPVLVYAYHLAPGEQVTRDDKGNYSVQF